MAGKACKRAIAAESTWRHIAKGFKILQGAAIETAKFVDSISFEHAAEGLHSLGFPSNVVSTWVCGIKHINLPLLSVVVRVSRKGTPYP